MNTNWQALLSSLLPFITPFVLGMGMGSLFIFALWFSVQKGVLSPHPVRWFLGGVLLRTSVTLSAFYLIANGDWQRLVVCLLGFVVARQWFAKRLAYQAQGNEGQGHAY
jgi:F1F0 ATPase subunit 2